MPNEKPKCFISYSHKDKKFCTRFLDYFTMIKRFVDTDVWYDGKIPAGGKISQEVKENLLKSDVVFLLITPNFIASEWCYEKEMQCALKRNNEGKCIIIPVIIQKIVSENYPFNDLNFVPTDGRPITNFKPYDNGFVDAFNAIKSILQNFNNIKTKPNKNKTLKKAKTNPTASKPKDNLVKYEVIVNGRLKSKKLSNTVFKKVLDCNNSLPAFVADVISVTKESYDTFLKKVNAKKSKSQDILYWRRRCMEDFLFQTATYLQQHFIGIENTCVHFRVCQTNTYDDFLEVGYTTIGLSKEPIVALNGMIETAFNNNFPAIKSLNKELHKVSHPHETTQRDYVTCFFNTLYKTYGIKISMCLSMLGKNTTEIQNTLTALSIIRIDNLIDKLINHYICLCVEADPKYDVCQIFNK